MLLTTATAWAWDGTYIDEDGDEQTVEDAFPIEVNDDGTSNLDPDGWYYVEGNVTINSLIGNADGGDIHIILCDGATLNITNEDGMAIRLNHCNLYIYGQSAGTGKLIATSTNFFTINTNGGDLTIAGGIVTATSIVVGVGSITLAGGAVKASSYYVDSEEITIDDDLTYYDGTGASYESAINLNDADVNNRILSPWELSGTCGNGVTWSCDLESLTISGTGAMADYYGDNQPWKDFKQFITSVTIGDGVTSIGSYAFEECTSLTSVVIPDGVTRIGDGAFYSCTSLTSVTIPDGVTSIEIGAFYSCTSLAIVSGASGVTFIGPSAFTDTDWYRNLPSGLTTLGHVVYRFVGNGTSVTIPDGTTQIFQSAFQYSAITSIVIPASVTTIGTNAFYGSALQRVYSLRPEAPELGYNALNSGNLGAIVVPAAAYDSYNSGWSSYSSNLQSGYTVTCGADVTATTYAPIVAEGETVTLGYTGTDVPAGYLFGAYTVNGEAIDGNTFTMGTADVTVDATFTPDPAHFSVNAAGTEYTIHTATGWGVFCDALQDNTTYNRFSGKTVKLGNNIGTAQNPITRMAGSDGHEFQGNFDGGGNTLTFTVTTATDNYCAPFRNVKGGSDEDHAITISNLNVKTTITATDYRHAAGLIALQSGHVNVTGINADVTISSTGISNNSHDLYPAGLVSQASSSDGGTLTVTGCTASGTISTDGKYAAGLVGIVQGTATITDCISSVTIDSSTSGDGTHGGIVAALSGATNIYGTVFNGRLLGEDTESVGGFIGWRNKGANIYNSLFIPTEVTVKKANSATFARNDVDTHNCYYTYYLCDGEHYVPYYATDGITRRNGHARRTVAAAADVTIEAIALSGDETHYAVSGITAYANGGIKRTVASADTYYYGQGDALSLTLGNTAAGAPQGYRYDGYTASAGTLSGTTLTMPDEDVTITAALAPIDWATVNQGDSEDPYMIYNKDQLLLLAHRVNGTSGETANTYVGKFFRLGADITFDPNDLTLDEEQSNYEAIGGYIGGTYRNFCGIFDGDGHTVSGIRIRKTGNDDAYSYQGLFGYTDYGANIYDVHLTDASITGYQNVGGIAGYINAGSIMRCTVTDSHITADSWNYGTICGFTRSYSSLTNNYYHGCTVNGTAVTSGKGCKGADNNGALPAYAITLGANITTPPGTFAGQTEWLDTPPDGARLAPGNGFTLAGNHYFASGYEFTPGSTLASGAAQGYTPRATLGGQLLDLYTHMGDAPDYTGTAIAQFTVTADCDGKTLNAALRSTGQPVTVAYIDADGTLHDGDNAAQAVALDGHETVDGDGDVCLDAGTYYVGTDIAYANRIWLAGNITLILADGKTMTLASDVTGIDGGRNLTIYGQSLDNDAGTLRYNGTEAGIYVNNYEQHSGNVSITTSGPGMNGINANVTLRGGTLTVTANGDDALAILGTTHSILGGQLTATATGDNATGILALADDGTALTLGWTRPDDRITASSIITTYGSTVAVADGQALTDGSGHIYTGTLTASVLSGFAAETTLQPCLALADAADNTAAIADHAGQTLAVALSGRTLYKDGAWNTLCLPFDVELEGSPLDDATAKTVIGTTTSGNDITINFGNPDSTTEPVTVLKAGVPYIIKWDATNTNIVEPVFTGVTVVSSSAADRTVSVLDGAVKLVGYYDALLLDPENGSDDFAASVVPSIYYMTADNTLKHTGRARTLHTCRAYFQFADEIVSGAREIKLNFGEDETTGIVSMLDEEGGTRNEEGDMKNGAWYTVDGVKLNGKPTRKGLYIFNGKVVVIK
jgi:hypothetical protein